MAQIIPTSSWSVPPEALLLGNEEVHVWRAKLDLQSSCVQSLIQILSADERTRAERFYFQKDRERFIVARGLLRVILGRYTNMEPSQLQFCYNPYGKPDLANESGGNGLCFNLSHSDGLALYAITRGRQIGVDIERIRPDLAGDQIAERFFSPREVKALRSLPPSLQPVGFFNCWTRKEAYIKARGKGLTLPLDQFDVSLVPGEQAVLLGVSGDPEESSRWSLLDFLPGTGYAAALAVEGSHWVAKYWQLTENMQRPLSPTDPSVDPRRRILHS
jgi:4'-phosphopantetheinyl transferase